MRALTSILVLVGSGRRVELVESAGGVGGRSLAVSPDEVGVHGVVQHHLVAQGVGVL